MLESTGEIFSHYIGRVSFYTINSVEMVRGQNPEDRYYLCNIDKRWFVVYETDFIHSLAKVLEEAIEIYGDDELFPLHWLVKKESQNDTTETTIPLYGPSLEDHYEDIVLAQSGTYLRQAVIEFASSTEDQKRYNPNTYGSHS
ncbi:MAG TPA: hypothetical protein VJ841_03000 [Candidatus Saccharimonadales bacterium]|nr:hypothetical protein [Candidatus Saccharimonadales bacterium]